MIKMISFCKVWLPLLVIWSFVGIAFFDGTGTTFYRIKEKYGKVITQFNGERLANTKTGIHFRFNSWNPKKWILGTEEYSMRSQFCDLDNNPEPHDMQASDKIKFMGSGMFRYRIVDIYKFGVTMGKNKKDAETMLARELNSLAKSVIQSRTIEENVAEIDKTGEAVFLCNEKKQIELKYGIIIESFKMTSATYPKEMNEKTAEAKLLKIMGEATKSAADDFKKAKETKAEANKYYLKKLIEGARVTTEEGRKMALSVLRDLNLYDMLENRQQQGSIIVIPHGNNSPNLTLPQPGKVGK
ncbi:MAG: hypothetical protein K9M15_01515 [Candidatus Marinimicrobia bacterium]|nr:hypothetical protein [Candidatus Neomarinimicrobiota bacterium]